jgi:hypothetical protein
VGIGDVSFSGVGNTISIIFLLVQKFENLSGVDVLSWETTHHKEIHEADSTNNKKNDLPLRDIYKNGG